MSDADSPDQPGKAVHPEQPAEGDREEVDRALADAAPADDAPDEAGSSNA
jgi:hypothetical protein